MKLGKRLRAAAALLLSAVMLLWTGLPVTAAYENTHNNTGKPSQDILAAAESQLGYTTPADGAKYNRWYGAVNGNYTYSWCQTFLSWCAEQAEIGTDVIPKEASVSAAWGFFQADKRFLKSQSQGGSDMPRAGDIAFYSETGDAADDSWVDLCAHFHAVLDYPDEDIDPFTLSGYEASLTESSRQLTALLASCHRGRMVQSGIRAVILGSPNAGKSSLLNRLSGFDRVIVTDIPGTTRDTVEQTVTLGRHLVRLVDTAGIRDTQDVIEKIGVDRSMEAAKDCDAALFVVDASRPLTDEDRRAMGAALEAPEAIAILNKQDLAAVIEPSDLPFSYIIPVSCKDGTGFDQLEQAFDMLFPDNAPCDGSLLTNARQAGAILRAKKSVDSAVQSLRAGMTPDAVLVDLEAAMDALGEVTGRTMREDITNRIFERFCVGK